MKRFLNFIRVLFVVILVFSYPISFLDSFNSVILLSITNIYYIIKKVLLVGVAVTLFTTSKERPTILKMFLFGTLFFACTFLIYEERRQWLIENIFDYFCCFTVFGAVILTKKNWNSIINTLVWGSRIFCFLISYALFTQLDVEMAFFLRNNYMFFSNAMMIPCGILIYSSIANKRYIDIPFSIFCCLLLFLGSRGSLLSMIILACTLYILISKGLKLYNIFLACLIIVTFFITLNILTDFNIIDIENSRSFNFLKYGTNWGNEDRFKIWKEVISGTSNPFFGEGYLADRQILYHRYGIIEGAAYAHNIFIELYADLGLVGLGITVYLYYQLIKQMLIRSSYQYLIVTFFFISAFQLLFSRTVFTEPNFFILLGILHLNKK